MNTKDIIFIHGWGEDHRIWEPMAELLPGYNHHLIDLGFIGSKNDSLPETQKPALVIAHSLGTLWALKHIHPNKIAALAAINGFGRFTDFASNETLKIMAKSLHRNKILQMKSFWKNCNFPQNMRQIYKAKLNGSALSQGLEWLSSWDEYYNLQELKTCGVSILSLGGMNDLILPADIMCTHWEGFNLVMREEAGHSLPLEAPDWCTKQIKEFLG